MYILAIFRVILHQLKNIKIESHNWKSNVIRKVVFATLYQRYQMYVRSAGIECTVITYFSAISLREKSPNMEFFLVRIFQHSD